MVGCRASDTYEFKFRPTQGKELKYQVFKTTQYEDSIHFPGDTIGLWLSLENKKQIDSSYLFDVAIEKLVLRKPAGFRKNIGDSLSILTEAVIVSCRFDQVGKIQELSIFHSKIDSIRTLSIEAAMTYGGKDKYFSEQGIKDLMLRLFAILPGRPVKVGDLWTNTHVFTAIAPVKFSTIYKLTAVNGDTARVSLQTVISATISQSYKPYFEGEESGVLLISLSTGLPISINTESHTTYTTNKNAYHQKELFAVKKVR